jgi:hypothetical protein
VIIIELKKLDVLKYSEGYSLFLHMDKMCNGEVRDLDRRLRKVLQEFMEDWKV